MAFLIKNCVCDNLQPPTVPDIDMLVNSAVDKHTKAAEAAAAAATSVGEPSFEGAAAAQVFVTPLKKEQLEVWQTIHILIAEYIEGLGVHSLLMFCLEFRLGPPEFTKIA